MTSQSKESKSVSFKQIDQSIKTLDRNAMKQAPPDDFAGRVQKLVEVFGSIKPLLGLLSTVSLIPPAWRAALTIFTQSVEGVVSWPEIPADFKAGKDL